MRLRSMALAFSLVLTASMLLPSFTLAQAPAARDWSALKSIVQGSKLSVKLKGGKTVEGRLSGVTDTALTLSVHDKATDFARDDVLSVYRVKGQSAAKPTLIGAGVGAGVGAVVGASSEGNFILSRGEGAAVLAVLGAGAGALAGFVVGKTRSKRVLVYEAGP